MKKSFPLLTLGVGLFLALILLRFSPLTAREGFILPLLTALLMSELGFIITIIGTGVSVRDIFKLGIKLRPLALLIGNLLLVLYFINQGFSLWSKSGGLGGNI
jgi:hypothetical protein